MFPLRIRVLPWLVLLVLSEPLTANLRAQELAEQPTPFSVWLDFRTLVAAQPSKIALPIWLESLTCQTMLGRENAAGKTIFRLRFRRLGDLNNELQLRLFYEDRKSAEPVVTSWSETGVLRFERTLGTGLELPTSEAVALSMDGVDYVDVEVPGDGSSIRGAFLASQKKIELRRGVDFPVQVLEIDPFENAPLSSPKSDDLLLFGRVKATLDASVVKLTPGTAADVSWEFELQAPPLLAVLTFEILNADPLAAPEVTVNDQNLGTIAVQLPDLADPAYLGLVRPLDRDMRFRYTGWIRCQKAIPGSALQAGLNKITLRLHKESGPLAVRAVEMQLKHNWQALDYTLSPSTP